MNQILLLPLNILLINHLLLPFNILPISHLLLLINILPISHLLLPLYPKTPRNRNKARWSKTKRKRKRAVPFKTKTKQRRKNQYGQGMEMSGHRKAHDKKGMYFRGRDTRRSWPWLYTLWHISNGYRNEWTSRKQCNGNE